MLYKLVYIFAVWESDVENHLFMCFSKRLKELAALQCSFLKETVPEKSSTVAKAAF